jgi:hypothetical protein
MNALRAASGATSPGTRSPRSKRRDSRGLKNGQLLRAAAVNFDVLVTVDQNLPHQQNLSFLNLLILLLIAGSNRYQDLQPLVPKALDSLEQITPGEIVRIA